MTRVVAFFQPGWADWEAGSAPGTFASQVLQLVAPAHRAAILENDAMMAREWAE